MANEYRVEAYSAEHRAAVLQLFRQLLPRSPRLIEAYFAWKYEQNPYLRRPRMALVFSDCDLVAMRGLVGTRWSLPTGEEITVPAAEDLIVDARHRDRGLFLLIDRELRRIAAHDGHPSVISLSAGPTTRRLQPVTGWQPVAALMSATRPALGSEFGRSQPAVVRRMVGRARSAARRAGLHPSWLSERTADRAVGSVAASDRPARVTAVPDIEGMVRLATLRRSDQTRHARSPEFYRWRLGNPDRRYRVVEWRDEALRGFVVLAVMPSTPPRVRVVDSAAEDPAIHVALLRLVAEGVQPALALLPTGLPEDVRGHLAELGMDDVVAPDRRPLVEVFECPTGGEGLRLGPTRLHIDLLDTMVA